MSFFENQNNWPLVALKYIAMLKRGYDLPTKDRVEGGVPIYAANGVNGRHNEVKIKGPGVITGRSGTIGKVHYTEQDYWPLNTALYVTNFHGNDPKWVYYMLCAFKLDRYVEGAGVPTLNRNLVHDELIPLPPVEEQKRIAAILDKADAIRQKRKQAIDLADEFLRSVFLDMFGDPVTNPKGWETKSLKEVSSHINDCPHSTPKWTDAGVICLRTSNLTKGGWNWDDTRYVSDETYKERTKRGKLEQDDIILSREGTVGIAALVPESIEMCMGQRLVQVRANREFVLPEYLLYLLLFELEPKRITRLMAGSTSKHINVRDLKQLKILLPSIDLQRNFVELMNKSKEITSSMVLFSSESANSSLALSQKAFSGQL
ncbi:restriction endonuclease subunit S [Vibrio lentus]|uniref:restriction endonuclease subunit S n=1 Tax=Vibrio lentus TaxID=136468 RepID=UPI000C82B0C9|nr:restriction endonuclease subunit S [Vibrio lentus]PMI39540.1 hypothetical protein BCU45_04595 [Vibrio lentus]